MLSAIREIDKDIRFYFAASSEIFEPNLLTITTLFSFKRSLQTISYLKIM